MNAQSKKLALSFLASAAGLLIGPVAGFVYGVRSVQAVTTDLASRGEFVCGTGLIFLPFFFAILGMILGVVPGLVAAVAIWLRNRPKGKSDFSSYYGA